MRRAIALMMLAALAFAQASIALAACDVDRGSLAQAEGDANCPCVDESSELTAGCIAHCTSDLQLAGAATVIARAPADTPVLFVASMQPKYASSEWQEARPPGGLSARILFQSFLI